MKLVEKVFGTHSEREIKRIKPLVDKILNYDSEYSALSEDELKGKTEYLKDKLRNGATLESILPEAFATVREAAWRVLGMKPFPVQVEGGVILHQGRIAELATGEGKAVTLSTKLPTPSGWKTAGDVRLGDLLFDVDGNPTTVVGVYPQGKKRVYKITFEDGRYVECSEEHLWEVLECKNNKAYIGESKVINTGEILSQIENNTYYIPVCKAVNYDKKAPKGMHPYSIGCCLNVLDKIPKAYKLSCKSDRLALVQGFMDKYASVGDDGVISCTVTSDRLANDICEILYSLGLSCEYHPNEDEVKVYVDNETKMLLFTDTESLEKIADAQDGDKNYNWLKIISIIPEDRIEEQVCFKVSNKRHLFLVGDYIVTHNTLTATMPAYLNALTGKGVFIITVNDYLAERDSTIMGKVYSYLGLRTGLIIHSKTTKERREAYNCDIVYGTNNEIGFDYLKDNMVNSAAGRVQRGFNYCIVDEVDSVLIDDSRTPLIISGMGDKSDDGYVIANEFVRRLKPIHVKEAELGSKFELALDALSHAEREELYGEYDYVVEDKTRSVSLTEKGIRKAEKFYDIENYASMENQDVVYYVERALKAYGVFQKDTDYVVKNGEVLIVDESTGRIMDGRRYSDGIHQAIEAKEGVNIRKESKTMASITFQNFFRKFNKLAGMTGTALTEEKEFRDVYGLDVVTIPTNKPILRVDLEDAVYMKRKNKLDAIVERIKEVHSTGQPLLVGTVSVERSEELSDLLTKEGIPHNVLNAKFHEQEAYIIAQAGKEGAVTIATNMAGRGTDIMLGGNADYLAVEELRKENYTDEQISDAQSHAKTEDKEVIALREKYNSLVDKFKKEIEPKAEEVKNLGGLYVIGTERHESRRIDNQLKGRSGRQGDPGVSEFFVSLEDNLMKLFASNKIMGMFTSLDIPDDMPISMPMLTRGIENAQQNIESTHAAQRANTLEYDEVISEQRESVYRDRNKILDEEMDYTDTILKMAKEAIPNKVRSICDEVLGIDNGAGDEGAELTQECILQLIREFEPLGYFISIPRYKKKELSDRDENQQLKVTKATISAMLLKEVEEALNFVAEEVDETSLKRFQKHTLLLSLDRAWQDHMVSLDILKQGIGLQAYGQKKPIEEFKLQSYTMFNDMIDSMHFNVVAMNLTFASRAKERYDNLAEEENEEDEEQTEASA